MASPIRRGPASAVVQVATVLGAGHHAHGLGSSSVAATPIRAAPPPSSELEDLKTKLEDQKTELEGLKTQMSLLEKKFLNQAQQPPPAAHCAATDRCQDGIGSAPRRAATSRGATAAVSHAAGHSTLRARMLNTSNWQQLAISADGTEARPVTRHAEQRLILFEGQEWLTVASSSVCSGFGVFAARNFKKDDLVVPFDGEPCGPERGQHSEYVLETRAGCLDGVSDLCVGARINYSSSPNVEFLESGQICARVAIAIGTELLVSYGSGYLRHHANSLASNALSPSMTSTSPTRIPRPRLTPHTSLKPSISSRRSRVLCCPYGHALEPPQLATADDGEDLYCDGPSCSRLEPPQKRQRRELWHCSTCRDFDVCSDCAPLLPSSRTAQLTRPESPR